MLRKIVLSSLVFCSASAALAPPPAAADDWPMFRHDRRRTAVTSEKLTLPLQEAWYFRSRLSRLVPKNLQIVFPAYRAYGMRRPLPEHVRYALAIAVSGDSVFFTSSDGRVVCLDAKTGKMRWEFVTGGSITCAPNVSKGKVYVGSDDGYVYCLDGGTGKLAWKYAATPGGRWFISFGRMSSTWAVRTDVLVDEGAAYFGSGILPHDGMSVNAITAKSGKRLWRKMCHTYGLAGHIVATKSFLVLPTEFKGFHKYQTLFPRVDNKNREGDLGYNTYLDADKTSVDAVKDGVRYKAAGSAIQAIGGKSKQTAGNVTKWQTGLPNAGIDASTVTYAGGVVYCAANDLAKGANGGAVYALDAKDGKQLWSARIPERPHHLAIANGRLFLSTRNGSIYSFAPKGTAAHGKIVEAADEEPFAGDAAEVSAASAAGSAIKASGVKAGFALVLDCENGILAYELAKQSGLYVCAVFDDAAKAQQARVAFSRANMHSSRISVWHRAKGTKLPYSSKFAALIVSERGALGGHQPEYSPDVARLLKPIRGVALMRGKRKAVSEWVHDRNGWQAVEQGGFHWAKFVRPPLKNAGGWTHALGSSGNTLSSHDSALKGPLGVVWYGPPYVYQILALRHKPEPTIVPLVVNGVMVCPTYDHYLEGYDQYDGRFLWRMTGENLGRRSTSIVAGGDSFYIPFGKIVQRYSLMTGQPVRQYNVPFSDATSWGQFSVSRDGKTIWGAGSGKGWRCLFALDAATGKARWTIGGPGKKSGLAHWTLLSDNRMYLLGGAAKGAMREQAMADMRAYLQANDPARLDAFEKGHNDIRTMTAIDATAGKVLYEVGVDMKNCNQWFAAHAGKVVFAMRSTEKYWSRWPGGAFRGNNIAVYDGATGKLLWKKPCNYRFRPVVNDDTIYAEPWAYDFQTGKRKQRVHPITGEPSDWSWVRYDKQCGGYNGSTNFLFGRSKGLGYYDALRDRGMYVFWHSRQACSPDTSSGGGMMLKTPLNCGCACPWSMPFSFGMGQVSREPAVPFAMFAPGRTMPVKHLHINFGAVGDRKDKDGNLWLHPGRRGHPTRLDIAFSATVVFYPGGGLKGAHGSVAPVAGHVPVENARVPFVFDGLAHGLKRVVVPVVEPAVGKGTFTVRLGFAALPGDKLGQRVFDIRLNGKVVLKDFDIIKEAGKASRAVWKEFTVPIDGNLIVDLVAKADTPKAGQMPVLNGLVVVRKKMITLGMTVPGRTWLNKSKLAVDVTLELANFRPTTFDGRLVIEAPKGISVALPQAGKIVLPPGARQDVHASIKTGGAVKVGTHVLTVRLVSAGGRVEVERKMPLDWLGALKRKVVGGGVMFHMPDAARHALGRRAQPAANGSQLPVSKGAKTPGDLGAGYAYLSFGIPREVVGIRRARVQLHVAPELWRIREALFAPADAARPGKGDWGAVKRIKGVSWADINKMKFPNRPELSSKSVGLVPTAWAPDVVEAVVAADVSRRADGYGTIQLAIDPTALNGPVYAGAGGWNARPGHSPALMIDYEPKKVEAAKK